MSTQFAHAKVKFKLQKITVHIDGKKSRKLSFNNIGRFIQNQNFVQCSVSENHLLFWLVLSSNMTRMLWRCYLQGTMNWRTFTTTCQGQMQILHVIIPMCQELLLENKVLGLCLALQFSDDMHLGVNCSPAPQHPAQLLVSTRAVPPQVRVILVRVIHIQPLQTLVLLSQ